MFSILSQFIFGNSLNFLNKNGTANGPGGEPLTESGSGAKGSLQSQSNRSSLKSSSWKDKSLCFDIRSHDLEVSGSEKLIGCFYPIEDVKGNQDEPGVLKITNLRLIWICRRKRRVNLSIGWRTVSLVYEQNLKDALGGSKTNLFVLTKYESTKYEFVFDKQRELFSVDGESRWDGGLNFNQDSLDHLKKLAREKNLQLTHLSPDYLDDPFEVVFKVWHSYKHTQLFRHCRTNMAHLITGSNESSKIKADQMRPMDEPTLVSNINRLPSEEIIEVFLGTVLSESKSTKYNGTLMLSNIRIIWIDDSLPFRNLSIPYIRVNSIKLKGEKILVNTYDYVGSTTCADFRLKKAGSNHEPGKYSTKIVYEQIVNFFTLYASRAKFGPESCDEILSFMSHLKPIEDLLDSKEDILDPKSIGATENFGPQINRFAERVDDSVLVDNLSSKFYGTQSTKQEEDPQIDTDEGDEFDTYRTNVASYLDEQPVMRDNDLIYSPELGLAVERPTDGNDFNLMSVWKIVV